MNIRPIRNEQDYKAALKEAARLFENPLSQIRRKGINSKLCLRL